MIEKGETAIRSWKKELLGFVCCLLALVIFCAGASAVVLPKRYDYGSTWDMYLKEEEDTIDVMFFGSSLAYCDVVPATIYQETGITSYVMAGPEQTMPITYRYLRQACKTQSPQVVFLEATGMFYPAHSRSTAVNICYMPWSLDRLALTFQVAEPDEWPGLLFPLYSYHSRWTELTWQEVGEGLFGYGPDDLAGYTFLEQVYPVTAFTQRDMGSHPEAYQQSLQAVEDILAFCEEEGIRAVFYLAPHPPSPSPGRSSPGWRRTSPPGAGSSGTVTRTWTPWAWTCPWTFSMPTTSTTGGRRSSPATWGSTCCPWALPPPKGRTKPSGSSG